MQLTTTHYSTVEESTHLLSQQIENAVDDIALAVMQEDLSLQVNLLQKLAGLPHVSNVHIVDRHGEQIWVDNPSHYAESQRIIKQELMFNGQDIGDLEVYLNYASVRSASLQEALPAAFLFLLETLLLSIVILWVLNKSFTRRISALVDSIDLINLNTPRKSAIPASLTSSGDEIGQIAGSIQKLYQRIRADMVHNKLSERTLKQHKTLLAEALSAQTGELVWQNRANTLLAELSLRLLKGHNAGADHDVRLYLPEFAKLFEADHIFWLSLDQEKVRYRISFPEGTDEPLLDLSDMYLVKRWLMDAQEIALVDSDSPSEKAILDQDFLCSVGIHSAAMFPLTDGRKSFGMLAVTTNHRSLQWNGNKSLVLKQLAALLSELVVRERDHQAMSELQEELIMANERLRLEAETDELTRLLNRRPFSRLFSNALFDAVDQHSHLAIMMIDIDHFKAYNDIYGHLKGDAALKYVAREMNNIARQFNASLARFGGEEFAMLLPHCDVEKAQQVAWQLCQAVRDLCIPHQGSLSNGIITISIGGAICQPSCTTQPNQLLEMADQYLYKAKRAGRNRAELTLVETSEQDFVNES